MRSSDRGSTWSHTTSGDSLQGAVSLTRSGSLVVASNDETIYISSDLGTTWNSSFTISLPKRIWHLVTIKETIYGFGVQCLLYSTDRGSHWSIPASGIGPLDTVECMAVYHDTLFAGLQSKGLKYSADGGANWMPDSSAQLQTVFALLPLDSAMYVLCDSDTMLVRTTNAGITWQNVGLLNWSIYASANALVSFGKTLYIGTGGWGVLYSTDQGSTWADGSRALENIEFPSLTATPRGLLMAEREWGIRLMSWDQSTRSVADSGLAGEYVTSVACIGHRYFAGTNKGLFASEDSVVLWSKVENMPWSGSGITGLSAFDKFLFVQSGRRLYRFDSRNGGARECAPLTGEESPPTVAMHGTLFAAQADGVYSSNDSGITWLPFYLTGLSTRITALYSDDTFLYVGTTSGCFSVDSLGTRQITYEGFYPIDSTVSAFDVCAGVLLVGSTGGVIYMGDPDESRLTSIPAVQMGDTVFAFAHNGTWVMFSDKYGLFTRTIDNLLESLRTGVREASYPRDDCAMYPNPVSDLLRIDLGGVPLSEMDRLSIRVVDMAGKSSTVEPKIATLGEHRDVTVHCSTFPNGLYLLQIQGEGTHVSRPFVVWR